MVPSQGTHSTIAIVCQCIVSFQVGEHDIYMSVGSSARGVLAAVYEVLTKLPVSRWT